MGENKDFLEIVDVKKAYGEGDTRQEVLRGMNFSVANGEFCVLLGPSGSGKSTLLNIIGGIDNADSGYSLQGLRPDIYEGRRCTGNVSVHTHTR